MIRLGILLSFPLWAAAACTHVNGDRILARDLVGQIPSFQPIPGDAIVGFTPFPGTSRTLTVRELNSFASRYGVPLPAISQDLCVERAGAPLSRSALLEAMKKALGIESAQIDLLDYSKSIFPSGELEFSRATLSPPATDGLARGVIWRGRVAYGDHKSAPVWVRVRISVLAKEYVAARDLSPGEAIGREDIRQTTAMEFPGHLPEIQNLQDILGHSVRRVLKAGEILRPAILVSMPDVNRGDAVTVIIQSGAARLKLTALAQSSGRTGDIICLQNPENHRIFRGTVLGKDQVSVGQTQRKEHGKIQL